MKYLKKLTLSLTLICALTAAAFAGETGSPPCIPGETGSPPCACVPGETSSPPCTESTDPGQTNGPPASEVVDLVDIVEAALWSLSLL